MTQNKYVVGKKYKINYPWYGYEDAIVTVVDIEHAYRNIYKISIKYKDGSIKSFETESIIDNKTIPYEEEKPIVTEKVTKFIEAACYGELFVDEFKVGVDKTVTIGLACSVFTKEEVGKLIKTLEQIHEVM